MTPRFLLVALAAVAFGATPLAAAEKCPQSQSTCVYVLEDGRFRTVPLPFEAYEGFAAINDRGQMAVTQSINPFVNRVFLRSPRGRLERIFLPGLLTPIVTDINNRGELAGQYCRVRPNCENAQRGFLRDSRGRVQSIDYPGAVYTAAQGLNDKGHVVGEYLDRRGVLHGFRWTNGRFTRIDVPREAASGATDVNNRGEIVGGVIRGSATRPIVRGYVLRAGIFRKFAVPRFPITVPLRLNERAVAGFVTTAFPLPQADEVHGFRLPLRDLTHVRRIDYPGAPRTLVSGMNNAGDLAGVYENPSFSGPPAMAGMATRKTVRRLGAAIPTRF
jgi:probable HAF family extracellular repeat protein